VKLDFLDADRAYRAQIYRDGANADWRTHPQAIAIERREVRRGDTLQLKLAPRRRTSDSLPGGAGREKQVKLSSAARCCGAQFHPLFSPGTLDYAAALANPVAIRRAYANENHRNWQQRVTGIRRSAGAGRT